MGEMRQRHAVDAAAHGDGDLVERREHLRQGALQRNHGVRPTARKARATAERRAREPELVSLANEKVALPWWTAIAMSVRRVLGQVHRAD